MVSYADKTELSFGTKFLLQGLAIFTAIYFGHAIISNYSKSLGAKPAEPAVAEVAEAVDPLAAKIAACRIPDSYPNQMQQWEGLICKKSIVYGVDTNLLAAVVYQESKGDASVISFDGGVGLMQVMPRDGEAANFLEEVCEYDNNGYVLKDENGNNKCTNLPLFRNRPTINELLDPEFNMDWGTEYLSGLLSKYGGDSWNALREYNGSASYADTVLSIYYNY